LDEAKSVLKILILNEAKLDQKAGNNQFFFSYRHNSGLTGQNRHNWPDFFCQGTFFEVLGKAVARGPGPPINMLFQIFRLNFSRDMSKMHYFSNKFSKIAQRWGRNQVLGAFRPQRFLTFNIGDK